MYSEVDLTQSQIANGLWLVCEKNGTCEKIGVKRMLCCTIYQQISKTPLKHTNSKQTLTLIKQTIITLKLMHTQVTILNRRWTQIELELESNPRWYHFNFQVHFWCVNRGRSVYIQSLFKIMCQSKWKIQFSTCRNNWIPNLVLPITATLPKPGLMRSIARRRSVRGVPAGHISNTVSTF